VIIDEFSFTKVQKVVISTSEKVTRKMKEVGTNVTMNLYVAVQSRARVAIENFYL